MQRLLQNKHQEQWLPTWPWKQMRIQEKTNRWRTTNLFFYLTLWLMAIFLILGACWISGRSNNEYYLKIFWSASLRWLTYISFECLWVSFIWVSFVVAATNLPRYFLYVAVSWYSGMETPKFGFIEKHAGIIQDWWMERIKYLCDGDEQESAKALFKEFHLGDDLSFPQRF